MTFTKIENQKRELTDKEENAQKETSGNAGSEIQVECKRSYRKKS